MDVSRAQVANLGDEVELNDPNWPWVIRVRITASVDDRPWITVLTVYGQEPITSVALAQLPLRQITHVAASTLAGEGEAHYRMLAKPRPSGTRSWPSEHFYRVSRVASWALATGRPGGAAGAVAEFWGVHLRTARRWLSRVSP